MKKAINDNDIRKASNTERCQIILEIIKRTSSIYTRNKKHTKGGNMKTIKIENYLSSTKYTTRKELVEKTGVCDREVRNKISELKETIPVISHSNGKGYRLARDFQDFNTSNEARQELAEIEHCINEINSRKRSLDKTKKTYEAYVKKLKNNILFLENMNHIPQI